MAPVPLPEPALKWMITASRPASSGWVPPLALLPPQPNANNPPGVRVARTRNERCERMGDLRSEELRKLSPAHRRGNHAV